MGCTVTKRKPPVPVSADGKQPESIKSNKQSASDKNSSSSSKRPNGGTKDEKEGKKEAEKPTASGHTDISKLVTEKDGKMTEASENKKALKTLEEKSAKIPSVDSPEGDKKIMDNKTENTFIGATPLKEGQKLQPPKPDNGEYINFNDVLSEDDFSEAEDNNDGKKKERKEGGGEKKEEKKKEKETKKEEKKEAKKEEKKEKVKEKEKPKEQKGAKPAAAQLCLTVAPKQEKTNADRKSARSVGAKGAKKPEPAAAPKKPDGMNAQETKDAARKLRTGAVRSRNAPHEDTLYQVPHRMPEVDFTKMH